MVRNKVSPPLLDRFAGYVAGEPGVNFDVRDRVLGEIVRTEVVLLIYDDKERAGKARTLITQHFTSKLQLFLDFVLAHYVDIGVEELDQAKLTPLLKLKYHNSIADAVADLGRPEEIGQVFAGFQQFLYLPKI